MFPATEQGTVNYLSCFKFIGLVFLCELVKTNANCSIFEILFWQVEYLRHEVIQLREKKVLVIMCIADSHHKNTNIFSLGWEILSVLES